MTSPAKGGRIRLSVARRLAADYMWAASGIARVDVRRRVTLADVMAVRSKLRDPPSLTAIFVKAFAVVAAEVPELRRAYIKWPWPHLYEYADSTVSVLQERQIMGDIGVLPIRCRKPDSVPLGKLSGMIRRAADAPIKASKLHRNLIALAKCPLIIRRLVWGLSLNIPRLRRHTLGTYGVSSVARWQTELARHERRCPAC